MGFEIYLMVFLCLIALHFFDYSTDGFLCTSERPYNQIIKCIFFIVGLFLIMFAILRKDVGYDYSSYKAIYESIHYGTHETYYNVEFGFYSLNVILPTFELLIAIVGVLGVGLKLYLIYKYSYTKVLSLILYYSGIFLAFDMGVIRQGVAISFLFLSLKYIKEKKLIGFVICIILGSLFHVTILMAVPLYFLSSTQFSRRVYYSILLLSFILCAFDHTQLLISFFQGYNIPIVSTKVLHYVLDYTKEPGLFMSFIKRAIFFVFYIEFYHRKKNNTKFDNICINGYMLSLLYMGMFTGISILGGRGTVGLYSLQIFILGNMFYHTVRTEEKILISLIGISLAGTTLFSLLSGSNSALYYLPYLTII